MTDADILQIFRDTRALLDGHFLLRSGLHSRQYFQCALVLQHPRIAEQLCGTLALKLKDAGAQVVISPALGGLFVGHEVARALDLRHIFVEKNSAGKLELRRGFQVARGEKVLVVEDVVTTGGSTRETMEVARAAGGDVVGAASIIDRSGGSSDVGVPFFALATVALPTYQPDACPLCAMGTPAVKPGSRALTGR